MTRCKKNHKFYVIGESCRRSLTYSLTKPELPAFKFDAEWSDFLQMFAEMISYVAPKIDLEELEAIKKKINNKGHILNLKKN
jgi:hypothetical protein